MFAFRRTLIAALFCIALGTPAARAGDFSTYREFRFGTKLETVAKNAGWNPGTIRTTQQRPALIQEADWLPRPERPGGAQSEAVREAALAFYNGELYRIVVTYDRYKIEGLSLDDMIEEISRAYGVATRPGGEIPYVSNYGKTAALLARWETAEYANDLVRTGDGGSYSLVLYSKQINALAQAAMNEAARLELEEAPQRELDRLKQREQEAKAALDKARAANKPNFRP